MANVLDPVLNFAIVTVSTGYDASATSIVLTGGHGARLPAPATDGAFNLTWWNITDYPNPEDDPNVEIVRVTARSTDTLTVTRAQEGTAGSTKNTGGKTYKMVLSPTKKLRDDIDTLLQARVVGPGSATDNAIVRYDLTTGKLVQDSLDTISDAGLLSAIAMAITGTAGAGYLTLIAQSANPSAPAAGTLLLHSATTQGFTRLEQDNEAATNLVLGRDSVFIAKNTSGGTIAKGSIVYVSGATGNVPNIAKAKADSITTLPALGMVLDDIADNAFGQVMKVGIITSIDTNAFNVGDQLYVDPTTAGTFTATRPSGATNYVQRIGSVIVKGVGNGAIFVTIAPALQNRETGTNQATFAAQNVTVTDEAYDATNWNGSLQVPTKNAVRDKIEAMVIPVKASGAEVDTGTDDAKFVTAKAVADSYLAGDGWIPARETWTFASASTFTISGVDVTAKYKKGTFIKFTQSATVKYAVVASSSFSTNTTVTIVISTDYTLANAAISANYYSYELNPKGWPNWFAYTPTGPTNTTLTGRYSIQGWTCFCVIHGAVTGTPSFASMPTLPVAASAISLGAATSAIVGVGQYVDAGTANRISGISPVVAPSGTVCRLYANETAGDQALVSATNPITWANNDAWHVNFSYEI